MKLTPKQKAFAHYYVELGNATEAYIKAGYTTKTNASARASSSQLLTKPNVQAYITNIMAEKDKEVIASQNEVLELLTQLARGEMQEEQLVVYKNRYEKATKQAAPRDRVKALELLGKRYAMFTERVEATQEIVVEWVEDSDNQDND